MRRFTFSSGTIARFLLCALGAQLPVNRLAGQGATPFNTNLVVGLPATIEIEQFDNGGQSVGYQVISYGNSGGKFRPEGVSIVPSDFNNAHGYAVNNLSPGDWLQYSVYVPETTQYRIEVVAKIAPGASQSTTFHFTLDSTTNITPPQGMTVTNTPGWQTVTATTSTSIPSGYHYIRLVIDTCDSNYKSGAFDYMTIYKAPPTITIGSYTTPTVPLLSGTNVQTAQQNAAILQQYINMVPPSGGTVVLPGGGPYYICQPNPVENFPDATGGGPARPPLVLNVPQFSGNLRWDQNIWVGFQFTVGSYPITVTAIGRWVYASNTQSHPLALADTHGNTLAQVVLSPGQPAGQFAYVDLGTPYQLQANTTYAILSQEYVGCDAWFDNQGTYITLDGAANSVWGVFGSPSSYQLAAYSQNQTYGPVSLRHKSNPAYPTDNYAAVIEQNNIAIQGAPTTLVAFNRDTTILYIGTSDYSQPFGSGRSLDAAKRRGGQLALKYEPDGEVSEHVWPADHPGRGPFAQAAAADLMTVLAAQLVPLEQAILTLRVEGYSTREIAHRLRMSVGFVNEHGRHIVWVAQRLGL